MKKILVIGKNGQLATELRTTLASIGEILFLGKNEINVFDKSEILSICKNFCPSIIINTAAYTEVDKAEKNLQDATDLNIKVVENLANCSNIFNIPLIHYSTDYVFDGTKLGPYLETDAPSPINVYGKTKLEGERALESMCSSYLIFRVSWLYGHNGKNFYKTISKLLKEKSELKVVSDQIGSPTSAHMVALATSQVVAQSFLNSELFFHSKSGTYHLSASQECSWSDFAKEIARLKDIKTNIIGVPSCEYNSIALRPKNSVLSNDKFLKEFGFCLPGWQNQLKFVELYQSVVQNLT
jgi:dTDP-4-dehydrorhamnose reductase